MKDVLTLQGDTLQIVEAIERVGAGLSAGRPVPMGQTRRSPANNGNNLGRVTTVFSTKGGSGRVVIAVNLAVVLAERSTVRSVWSTPTCSSATSP